MVYYILLITAAVLYSLSFYFNRNVEKQCSNGIDTAILFSLVTWLEAFVILFAVMRGHLTVTPFSVICAFVHATFLIMFSFLNLKAFAVADLAKYSMFTMLGGMLVPFVFGIAFFGDDITAGKIICCLLVSAALYIESIGGKINKKAIFYLMAVFLVNGSFGVISTIHQNSELSHADTLSYMAIQSAWVICFGCFWMIKKRLSKNKQPIVKNKKAYANMLFYGIVNGSAELILLFAIKHVQPSVQYPIITGGVIIFSTLISMIIGENKNLKNLIPVGITFIGLLFLL